MGVCGVLFRIPTHWDSSGRGAYSSQENAVVFGATAAVPTAMNWTSVSLHTFKESKTLLPNLLLLDTLNFTKRNYWSKSLRKLIDVKRKKKTNLIKKKKGDHKEVSVDKTKLKFKVKAWPSHLFFCMWLGYFLFRGHCLLYMWLQLLGRDEPGGQILNCTTDKCMWKWIFVKLLKCLRTFEGRVRLPTYICPARTSNTIICFKMVSFITLVIHISHGIPAFLNAYSYIWKWVKGPQNLGSFVLRMNPFTNAFDCRYCHFPFFLLSYTCPFPFNKSLKEMMSSHFPLQDNPSQHLPDRPKILKETNLFLLLRRQYGNKS